MLGSTVVPFLSNLSINVGIILASSVLVLSTADSCCMINAFWHINLQQKSIELIKRSNLYLTGHEKAPREWDLPVNWGHPRALEVSMGLFRVCCKYLSKKINDSKITWRFDDFMSSLSNE